MRARIVHAADFAFVGVTGEKRFEDNSFFAGPDSVEYTVQGKRAGVTGPFSNVLTVNFGRVGCGGGARFTITGASESPQQGSSTGAGARLAA